MGRFRGATPSTSLLAACPDGDGFVEPTATVPGGGALGGFETEERWLAIYRDEYDRAVGLTEIVAEVLYPVVLAGSLNEGFRRSSNS